MIMYALLEGLLKEAGSFCRAHVTRPLVSLYILRHGQAASLLSTMKMAARSVEFWASLERNFSGIGCTLVAKTTVSNST